MEAKTVDCRNTLLYKKEVLTVAVLGVVSFTSAPLIR